MNDVLEVMKKLPITKVILDTLRTKAVCLPNTVHNPEDSRLFFINEESIGETVPIVVANSKTVMETIIGNCTVPIVVVNSKTVMETIIDSCHADRDHSNIDKLLADESRKGKSSIKRIDYALSVELLEVLAQIMLVNAKVLTYTDELMYDGIPLAGSYTVMRHAMLVSSIDFLERNRLKGKLLSELKLKLHWFASRTRSDELSRYRVEEDERQTKLLEEYLKFEDTYLEGTDEEFLVKLDSFLDLISEGVNENKADLIKREEVKQEILKQRREGKEKC